MPQQRLNSHAPKAGVHRSRLELARTPASAATSRGSPQNKIRVFGSRSFSSAQTVGQVRVVGADLHEPVVLGDSFTAGGCSGLELAAPGTDGEVCDEGVGGLTRAVGDHLGVPGPVADGPGLKGLADGAY